jgi:hypothetical protein
MESADRAHGSLDTRDEPAHADEETIRRYYECFNNRLLDEGAALYAADALLEQLPLRQQQRGGAGYLQFTTAWINAFPDAVLAVQRVASRPGGTHDISLVASGTHSGPLDLGGKIFRATGSRTTLHLRELLSIQGGQIVFSSLSFDLHEVIDQLVKVDCGKLLAHVERIRQLGEYLTAVQADSGLAREVIERLGIEIDAARHVVRPYFKR